MDRMGYHRAFLKAVVADWLTNGNMPIDGANDPREFVSTDWFGAYETTHDLVNDGFLEWASAENAERDLDGGSTYSMVIPTAKGVFEALS